VDLDRRADPHARTLLAVLPSSGRPREATLALAPALAAVPVLALLAYGFKLNPRDVPSPLIGRPASPFTLTAFDGTPVDLRRRLRARVVVVNFWAVVVQPACYEEAPVLEAAGARTAIATSLSSAWTSRTRTRRPGLHRNFSLTFKTRRPRRQGLRWLRIYGGAGAFFSSTARAASTQHVGAVTEFLKVRLKFG